MENRRLFIKKMASAGMASSFPAIMMAKQQPAQQINLLVRADDFGNSWGRCSGIIKAHKEGIVTSTSVMVPSQFFDESVQLCKANPTLAVGLHITLVATRTRSVLSPEIVPTIVNKDGFFYETMDELDKANPKAEEIEKEILAQVGKARACGLHFVYLDWHRSGGEQSRANKLRTDIVMNLCKQQKLVFGQDDGTITGYNRTAFVDENWPTQVLPDGQKVHYGAPALSTENQKKFFDRLNNMKPGKWIAVIHPGTGEPERNSVVELMCNPETKKIIKARNIRLVSYYDLWMEKYG